MTDAPPTRITCYNDLVKAFRARKAELGLSNEGLDDAAGLTRGHTSKLLGPSRGKRIGAVTIEALMLGLAVDLVMVESPEKLAVMQPHYQRRREHNVRTRARKQQTPPEAA
jgi:hypothetical protein